MVEPKLLQTCVLCKKEPRTSNKAKYCYSCVYIVTTYAYEKAKKQGKVKAFLRSKGII